MFLNVSVSNTPSVEDVTKLYLKRLNKIADYVVNKIRFGINHPINRVEVLKIKYSLPYLRNNVEDTVSLYTYISAINKQ